MPQLLDDPFAPSTATRPITATAEDATASIEASLPATVNRPDDATVEANYEALNARTSAARRAATARRNAATAREVAQSFSEYARGFRKVATTKGGVVDHAVAVFLAEVCEQGVDEYTKRQADETEVADREGSL